MLASRPHKHVGPRADREELHCASPVPSPGSSPGPEAEPKAELKAQPSAQPKAEPKAKPTSFRLKTTAPVARAML